MGAATTGSNPLAKQMGISDKQTLFLLTSAVSLYNRLLKPM